VTRNGAGDGRGRVLFVFLDGVGLAPPGRHNPLGCVPMPQLKNLLGGPLVLNGARDPAVTVGAPVQDVVVRALDACLGVPGLPQSATGQAALFTGVNAPRLVEGHVTAFPTARLRELLAERSLLRQAADVGGRVLFANAHSEQFWQMVHERRRHLGASTLTALAADAPIPTLADLVEGRALLWDITHEIATGHLGYDLPLVSAVEAGRRLTRLASEYDLVLFETFLPDLAGHQRLDPEWVLTRLDSFLGAILDHRPPDVTLVVCSDHGNLEDTSTKSHTTNPVPLLACGPGATRFRSANAITDVAPAILSLLEG
jgi:2,3-bisphosphoglycerate-independent phosphoglycerate mutase